MKQAPAHQLDALYGTAAVFLVCAAGLAVAAANGLLASASQIAIYLLANLILAFDVLDLLVRVWLKHLHGGAACGPSVDLALPEISNAERALTLQPYALIASVHDESDGIDRFLRKLSPFKDHVWFIDDASTDDTALRLRREGWKCLAGGVNRHKPGALQFLLRALPPEIESIVVLDPDVQLEAREGNERAVLEQVISDLQRSGAAACTPRIQARRGDWLVECQAFEYELACGIGRKSLGALACNSGVSVYRRSALEAAQRRHSGSIYAEDLENSLLLLSTGERIYYDDRLIISTRAKTSWRALLSQRVGWSFGGLRLMIDRAPLFATIARRSPLAAYQYVFYLLFNGVVLLPLKLAALVILALSLLRGLDDLLMTHLLPLRAWDQPLLFGLWYVKSTLVLFLACFAALPRGERARHLAIVPFYGIYALLMMLPVALGYLNQLTLRVFGRRVYADHYMPVVAAAGPTGGA